MKTVTVVVVVILMLGLAYTAYEIFRAEPIQKPVKKSKRGRPKGSKNKTAKVVVSKPKRGRGRPKGSKNKPKNVKVN